jgi:hypothetical protein
VLKISSGPTVTKIFEGADEGNDVDCELAEDGPDNVEVKNIWLRALLRELLDRLGPRKGKETDAPVSNFRSLMLASLYGSLPPGSLADVVVLNSLHSRTGDIGAGESCCGAEIFICVFYEPADDASGVIDEQESGSYQCKRICKRI